MTDQSRLLLDRSGVFSALPVPVFIATNVRGHR